MKYLLIVALFALASCNQLKYQSRFNKAIDSANYYFDKWQCAFNCHDDKMQKYYSAKQDSFGIISNNYYSLMYPNGNHFDKKEINCNCNCK